MDSTNPMSQSFMSRVGDPSSLPNVCVGSGSQMCCSKLLDRCQIKTVGLCVNKTCAGGYSFFICLLQIQLGISVLYTETIIKCLRFRPGMTWEKGPNSVTHASPNLFRENERDLSWYEARPTARPACRLNFSSSVMLVTRRRRS